MRAPRGRTRTAIPSLAADASHEYVMMLHEDARESCLREIASFIDEIWETNPDGGTYDGDIWGGEGDDLDQHGVIA
jgi:hypothetical protein